MQFVGRGQRFDATVLETASELAVAKSGRNPPEFLTGRSFATNLAFNLGGECIVICLGLVCVPYVLRRLGVDSFGILSLAWVLLAYMSLFDLGLSRATTKFAAEATGRGEHHRLPALLGSSISLQFALGLLGGSVLFALSPLLTERILKIPGPLVAEASKCFMILAFAVPLVLVTNCLRGALEALQRFDLINYVKVPANASMFLSPLLLLPFGGRLPSVILLMTVFRLAAMLAYLGFCLTILPKPGLEFNFERTVLRQLLRYGGWVTISNVTGPILMYIDRFVIGSLLSIGQIAYYTAPADVVNRALVVPASLGTILFPGFSSLNALGAKQKLEDFYIRSMKYMIVALGPALLLVAAFSREILGLWLGPSFASKSAVPLQILTLGVFFNSLGYCPYSLLQGVGKPNLTAIFHLIEIPPHLGLVWILVVKMGITGAAIASLLRVVVDAGLLFGACNWLRLTSVRTLRKQRVFQSILSLFVLTAVVFLGRTADNSLSFRIILTCWSFAGYCVAVWHSVFDGRDRQLFAQATRELMRRVPKPEIWRQES